MSSGNPESSYPLATDPTYELGPRNGRIIVTGAHGQLGSEICRLLGDRAIAWSRKEWDLNYPASMCEQLRTIRPAAVINCAAYTKVDQAEKDEAACFAVNAMAVEQLAQCCAQSDCKLLQVSTDYVFGNDADRNTPYFENDLTGPQSVYAASKLAGERAAQVCRKHFIVRTCGLYSRVAGGPIRGRNFVDTMLAVAAAGRPLRVVGDQWCTPSYVPDVARAILELVDTEEYGTFHITNRGATNWYEFAAKLFELARLNPSLEQITSSEYPTPAARPSYSVLNGDKFAVVGTMLPDWQDGLRSYFRS